MFAQMLEKCGDTMPKKHNFARDQTNSSGSYPFTTSKSEVAKQLETSNLTLRSEEEN